MSRQLELSLGPDAEPPRRKRPKRRPLRAVSARALAGRALHWAPVWLPFLLLLQITWFGLVPALTEKGRLDHQELEVQAREQRLLRDYAELERDRQMLDDPIFRERIRRRNLDPDREPFSGR